MKNTPDLTLIAVDVATAVAMAQFDALEAQSFRLADMVHHDAIDKATAVDMLYAAALASDLVRRHGADVVQEIIGAGFEVAQ